MLSIPFGIYLAPVGLGGKVPIKFGSQSLLGFIEKLAIQLKQKIDNSQSLLGFIECSYMNAQFAVLYSQSLLGFIGLDRTSETKITKYLSIPFGIYQI